MVYRVASGTGELRQCYCLLVKNTFFDNNFVNFSPNVTKFAMLIDIVDIDRSRHFGCYEYNFGGKLKII